MRRLLIALPLLLVSACATLTAEADQEISVMTEPTGSNCTLRNDAGIWTIEATPGTARVKRDYSPLKIACSQDGKGPPITATIEPKTRGRTYANILMGGVPALVDAHTGDGYEYDPSSVTLTYPQK